MGLFDEFVGGAPPKPEELSPPAGVPRITVRPRGTFDDFVGGAPAPEQAAAATDPYRNFNKSFGELKQTDLSPTDALRWKILGGASAIGMTPSNAQHAADAVMGIGSSLTPMGAILSAADFTYHAPKAVSGERKLANAGAVALDVLGAIPGVNYARRALRGTPTVIPAHTAPLRETRRGEPEIGGFVTPLPSEARAEAKTGYRAIENAPISYHPNAMNEMTDWARNTLPNPRFGPVFTPETAPNTYSMLERFGVAFPRGGPRPVNAYDFDALRQQLLAQKGAEAAAGRQAADVLDTFMLNPPQGMVVQGRQLLPALRETYGEARGNWRAYKTGDAIEDAVDAARIGAAGEHSGKNPGNRTRQEFQKYVKTPAGEAKLFGATPQQLNAIEDVAAGDWWTNKLRAGSNRLGGGGGWGQTTTAGFGGAAGGGLAHMLGLDPSSTLAMTVAGAGVPMAAGGAMRRAANARTARAGEEVAADIMRSSPLYRRNLAEATARGMGPMADPRIRARDAITMALMPGVRESGTDWVNEAYVPYEYR